MPIVTLRDLYIAELRDLFDAEQQIVSALPELSEATTSAELHAALLEHLEQTHVQLQRIELLLRKLDISRSAEPCEAIRGLIAEGRRRVATTERGVVRDAALIGAIQRIEHYEIAAYGCARAYAVTLGDEDAARLLQQTLDEEGRADHRLSRIASHGINQSAGEDVALAAGRQPMRLQYVAATGLPEFTYGNCRVRNARNEDLGTLDGLVIDSRSRRPIYFVVDSGGWFTGRRFLVPVGLLQPDEQSNTLRTDLDRETIHRYPPFERHGFPDSAVEAFDETAPAYQPPTWLMTGVWMTEASGFAAVPPRADPCMPVPPQPPRVEETYPENDLMMARGEPDDPGSPNDARGKSSAESDREPRIERYPER